MEIRELAALMARGDGNPNRSKTGQYYMLNINHPAVDSLRRRFCESRGIQIHGIMSDEERYEFELSVLHPGARKVVEEFVARYAEQDGKEGQT